MFSLPRSYLWLLPLVAAIILAPFLTWIDLGVTRFFYSIGNDPVEHFISHPFLDFLFDYGTMPANITGALAGIGVLLSHVFKKFRSLRAPCLVLLLTYAVGAGLLINGIFKEYWGRPRPKQVEEFGGTKTFRPFYSPDFAQKPPPSKSFPCGHCAMGFYFFALALVGNRLHNRNLFLSGMVLALVLGILLSLTRIMQGGHFVSDTLFSMLIMWYTALAMDWLAYKAEGAA